MWSVLRVSFLYSPFQFALAHYTFSYLISNLSKCWVSCCEVEIYYGADCSKHDVLTVLTPKMLTLHKSLVIMIGVSV